jgi:hypothetical protein
VALVNVSCGDSILVESILRENDQQKGFHAAKTRTSTQARPGGLLSSRSTEGANSTTPIRNSSGLFLWNCQAK